MEGTKTHHLITKENIIRTSKRTNGWSNEALSIRLKGKLSEELLTKIEASAPYTSVRGIHPNWRVAMYRDGETFPAHIDQADSVMVEHPEKMRQRFTSSHTLLIYLRRPGEQFQGKLCSKPGLPLTEFVYLEVLRNSFYNFNIFHMHPQRQIEY